MKNILSRLEPTWTDIKTYSAPVACTAVVVLFATGCSSITESFNDAPISRKDDSPAEVYSMPDGYANFASKCDSHGNRVYTTRTEGGEAMAVVPSDPSCD